jgi:predicted TIM-barrel fold metal-dependent hydrolase
VKGTTVARYYQVISADGHLETPPESWSKYVPEKWRHRAPRLIPLPEGGEGWLVEGQPMLHNGQNIAAGGPTKIKFRNASYWNPDGSPAPGAGSAEQRLREQDEDGIDAEVLFPPVFATRFLEGIADKDVYLSMVQAYNTFLAEDYCSVAPDRLIGNAVIPVSGIDDAVSELERIHHLGLRSVSYFQFPNGTGHPKPEDDRFWEKSLELGVRLSPHFGFGAVRADIAPGVGTGAQPFAAAACQRAGTHAPVYCMSQLIVDGVLDRFPEIQMYFAETNIHWLPGSLFMMDDSYECFRRAFDRKLPLTPSEYCVKHFHWGIIRDPVGVQMGPERIPFDRVMWGTDFPHSVGSYPDSQQFLVEAFKGLDDGIRRKVLLENPARYYGLDLTKPITETPAA